MPDFRSIIADIKKRVYAPVYILMGEEPYYIDQIMKFLEDTVIAEEDKEFDQSVLYGADSNVGTILEAATRYPLMSEKRLVLVKEAQSIFRAKSELDKLKSYIESPNPQAVLAIAYKGDKLNATSEIIKAAKKNKDIIILESPKIREYKIAGVVKDHCIANKIDIEERALSVIIANAGDSLTNLFSEIEKLQLALKKGEKRITLDLVHEHIGVSKEFNNFELVNALARKDFYNSINIIQHFEDNPKANPTVVTSATLFNFFQRLLIASFSVDKSETGLLQALQLKNAYALREIRAAMIHYNARQLVNIIHAIREFDTKSKGVDSFQKEFPLLRELVFKILTL